MPSRGLRFPGRDKIFLLYISLMMVPFTVLLIPLYVQMRAFGWISTLQAVIVPFLFTPWGTFMMRQFMVTIPRELEDAARIDGCGFFKTYWLIILPLTKPALGHPRHFHLRQYLEQLSVAPDRAGKAQGQDACRCYWPPSRISPACARPGISSWRRLHSL